MNESKKTIVAHCITALSIFPNRDGSVSLKINGQTYEDISMDTAISMIRSDVEENRQILFGS